MLIVGRRAIPWLLHEVAHSGSCDQFRLAVLAIALGAVFAGMILAKSPLGQRAGEEMLSLRDAFVALFLVSVGMLFNPHVVTDEPVALLAIVAIIVFGKSIAALLIVRMFGRPTRAALTISASIAQIGEVSFILATLGCPLRLIPADARDLILAGAILSIMLNPLLFVATPGGFEAGQIIEQARMFSRDTRIVARTRNAREAGHFRASGADMTIVGEQGTTRSTVDQALPGRRGGRPRRRDPPGAAL